jgi:hypothetical protein
VIARKPGNYIGNVTEMPNAYRLQI